MDKAYQSSQCDGSRGAAALREGCPRVWRFGQVESCLDTARKLAGVLLEERGGVLLAGVGLDVVWAPDAAELRAGAALEAICLAEADVGGKGATKHIPTAEALWQQLVICLYSAYNNDHSFLERWREGLDEVLLWRGLTVELHDDGQVTRGRLEGLGASGGVLLDTGARVEEFFCGSLRRGG